MHRPERTSCLAEITGSPAPTPRPAGIGGRAGKAIPASEGVIWLRVLRRQTHRLLAARRIVLQKMSARHIGSRRDTNRCPERKRREPKWRRASFAKPVLINRVSGENYMIWFLLLHHSAAANDIQGSSSNATHPRPVLCVTATVDSSEWHPFP